MDGGEYQSARKAANLENRRIHRNDSTLKGKDIHEPHPVKFGGDPTSPDNKVPLSRSEHSPFTSWWNRLKSDLKHK